MVVRWQGVTRFPVPAGARPDKEQPLISQGPDLFDKLRLPPELDAYLRDANPWWAGKPGRVLPLYRRWAFPVVLRKLETKVAPALVLRGARQVGKTTLQEQVIEYIVKEKAVESRRILRVQFDEIPSLSGLKEPILEIVRWFENRVLGSTLNEAAHARQPAYLFFDEVQNLMHWAPQIKALVDHHTVQVVVTGSSALRIEAGRDSLAGRITTLELGTLLLREIAGLRFGSETEPALPLNGLERLLEIDFWRGLRTRGESNRELRDQAFRAFSERGGVTPWGSEPSSRSDTTTRHSGSSSRWKTRRRSSTRGSFRSRCARCCS